ncbi:hypothetical protein HLB23_09370 [Nocardia uniformis]|uniref:Uncharacterized protein n=1 Tax=Nocardia uniformis TaxID=53432 RepID=A0A849BY88_9NOCA|nr:hypothetical protein [Nocardia uniformis]NNH70066.1 hypothetical protein [Nocardia uniformis]
MAGTNDDDQLMDEVLDMDDQEPDLDYDLGDDDQADEVREYERYIADPPDDLVITNRENDDTGRLGIERELAQEQTRRRQRAEHRSDDDRPAEVAAVEIVDDLRD